MDSDTRALIDGLALLYVVLMAQPEIGSPERAREWIVARLVEDGEAAA